MSGINSPLFGIKRSDETKKKLSLAKKGKFVGKDNWWYGKKRSEEQRLYIGKIKRELGNWKGEKNLRHIKPLNGELNGRWQGGITVLYAHLRSCISEWKEMSMQKSNYKCVITGDAFDEIHHTYSFKNIINDTLNNLGLPVKQSVYEYTSEEIELIEKECLRIHILNLGVCLRKDIHKLFHDEYGYGNNTLEHFEEFKQNYTNNKYDEMEVLNIGI
jgi:hypothetical protein